MNNDLHLRGTKAETLESLKLAGLNVPKVLFFTVNEWGSNPNKILQLIKTELPDDTQLAIRSSGIAEDSEFSSLAGAFKSILNVDANANNKISNAIQEVIASFDDNKNNQILVQPMVRNVHMSGVVMTKVMDDGSPYHVINYDDSSGLTDTVTNGDSINKTVYIYNGVKNSDFDSKYLQTLLELINTLESLFPKTPMDIEFAIDQKGILFLLQVRQITTIKKWNQSANDLVSKRIIHLEEYINSLMHPRNELAGDKTLLGIMPDWNPAEMIGVVPSPLSKSLYRKLITRRAWREARVEMGYRNMPNVELMISLFGRVYIDVRNSFNSFLPKGLSKELSNKLLNGFIKRLETNPHLHDKVEFEVVPTAFDFSFEEKFSKWYPNLLTQEELNNYREKLKQLTIEAIDYKVINNSLENAEIKINLLSEKQKVINNEPNRNIFQLSDQINTLLSDCVNLGTIPFSIIARHGFIAENMLRSLISNKVISKERIFSFKSSIKTVSTEMSREFHQVCSNDILKSTFLKKYGHLRPNSYDILSPTYRNRKNLFDGEPKALNSHDKFSLTPGETLKITNLFDDNDINQFSPSDLFNYAEKAIIGREYAKFIFTRHLSIILELIAEWGETNNFSREEMSMLSIDDILSILHSPLTEDVKTHYHKKVTTAKNEYDISLSFKLSYLIRSSRDIYVVPQQRNTPNFIGTQRVEKEIIFLTPYMENIPDLQNKLICIEGADPGYDWLFSRNISGLITKYGGANSHMAIRCAEYNLPAAIGCGEQPFERIISAGKCLLDCQSKRLEPIVY